MPNHDIRSLGPALYDKKGVGLLCTDSKTNGTVPEALANYITVEERGDGYHHQTVLTLDKCPVALANATSAAQVGATKIYDMPKGRILSYGVAGVLSIEREGTGLDADATGDIGVGSVAPASAANAFGADATDDDLGTGVATTLADGKATGIAIAPDPAVAKRFDGTSVAPPVILSAFLDSGGSSADDNLLVSGTLVHTWINQGGV